MIQTPTFFTETLEHRPESWDDIVGYDKQYNSLLMFCELSKRNNFNF